MARPLQPEGAVAASPGEPVLLENKDVRLTEHYLLLGRSLFPLNSIQSARVIHQPPRPWPVLLAALVAMGAGIPLTLAWLSTAGAHRAPLQLLLAITAALAFTCIIWLVVATRAGERRVFSSSDRELVSRWVSVLCPRP